jgi:hypothetical protein
MPLFMSVSLEEDDEGFSGIIEVILWNIFRSG